MAKKTDGKIIAQNKKARHDYFVDETYEAGIELFGTSTANATFTVYFKDDKLLPDGLVPGEKYTVYCENDGDVSGCSFIVNYYTEPPKGANYSS